MKLLVLALITVHGGLHFLGAAKGFGWAALPALKLPVPWAAAWGWAGAGVGLILFAALASAAVPPCWWVGIGAAALSQVLILLSWTDAKAGTAGNLLTLAMAAWLWASTGPQSLSARYEWQSAALLPSVETTVVEERELAKLPPPVARYLRAAGVVGQPRPVSFAVSLEGRIRGEADDPWMAFEGTQVNVLEPPTRLFFIRARKMGLPAHVLHTFADGEAEMEVRLLAAFTLVRQAGADATRAETVTLLNDMCLFAPGALLSERITWQAIDDRSAEARFRVGSNTVSAVLSFDERGQLANFVSSDRMKLDGEGVFVPRGWSTPLGSYRRFGPYRLTAGGEGRWHDGAASYPYIELRVRDVVVNPSQPLWAE